MNEQQVNIPIFYFSGTGNTWWVGNAIAEALTNDHSTARAISMEQVTQDEVDSLVGAAAMVGIGYPIYGSDAPLLVREFIKQLPTVSDKPMLVYVTQMEWSGNGAYFLHKQLERKGYQVRWAIEFRMPNNIGMHIFPVPSSPEFSRHTNRLQKAQLRIETLVKKVQKDEDWIQGKGLINTCLSWLQRGPWRFGLEWTQKRTWSVNAETCTHCGRCVRICPVDNIQLNDDGLPVWGDQCNLCLRCFNYCPEQAILVYKKRFDSKRNGIHPYRGPVPEFKPELITRHRKNNNVT